MSNDTNNPCAFERLTNDAMQRDYPERFNSREEWDAYNEECDRRDRERAHLKGGELDLGDLFDLPF